MSQNAHNADLSSLKIRREAKSHGEPPPRSFPWGWLVACLILGACGVGGGYYYLHYWNLPKVRLTPVVSTSASQASSVLTASGYIVPQRRASVASKATGRLIYLGVEEGDRVSEGQILGRLEDSDMRAQLNQAQAGLEVSKAQIMLEKANLERFRLEYERQQKMLGSHLLSKAAYDNAKADYQTAQARLISAEATVRVNEAALQNTQVALENTVIRAPFAGVVLTKNADIGEIVSPLSGSTNSKSAVVSLADMTSLQLEADVSESHIERIQGGMACEIILDSNPQKRYRGEVGKIVPTANRSKATVLVKVRFLDLDERVLPEMSAKVTFLGEAPVVAPEAPQSYLTLPLSAVLERNGAKIVFQVQEDLLREIPVQIGRTLGERIEILSGVKNGEQVVENPQNQWQAGQRIQVETRS